MAGVTGEQDWYVSGVFAMSFINLNDTIGDYIGRANKMLKVNAAEDGVTVVDATFEDHSTRHEQGGSDEVSVTGLPGVLADEQNPKDHASEHEAGASDELGPVGNKTNNVIRLINPAGAANIWDTASETGAIQIALPAVKADMIFFRATVFEYADQKSFDVIIAGYLDTAAPQWLKATAVIIGDNPNTKRVRFCRNADSSAWYVVIGDTGTSWGYPWIAISEFKAGHTPTITDWNNGWSMSLITSMPSYTDFDFTDARVSPKDHVSRHQDGGADELGVTGLSGVLADKQDPQVHGSRHKDGGSDELDVADLSGAAGSSGQVPVTDGATVTWGAPLGRRVMTAIDHQNANEAVKANGSWETMASMYFYINAADSALYFAVRLRREGGYGTAYARIYNSDAGASGTLSTNSESFVWLMEVSLAIGGLSEGWHKFEIQIENSNATYGAAIEGHTIMGI